MSLPRFQSKDNSVNLLQSNWASQLEPLLALPSSHAVILKSVSLATGDNTVNHTLGRMLQGWVIIRSRAGATIYDKQDSNKLADSTLILNSSAAATVDLLVF